MSKKFIQMTSGWIPVSVMLLFATALVMGQDRSGIPQETAPRSATAVNVATPGLLDPDEQAHIESIRRFVDAVLLQPETLELSNDTGIHGGAADIRPHAGPAE